MTLTVCISIRYESANYMNFVNHYFGSSSGGDEKKLMILSNAISNQFNPINSLNEQVTPVSIQISEQYQNLLQDYCMQQADDFLHSQIYICILVALLVVFSATTHNQNRLSCSSSSKNSHHHHKLAASLTSGKLLASQHEANLDLSPSHFQFSSSNSMSGVGETGNVFIVTILSAPIYCGSLVMHVYGQNTANSDLISSVTMVVVAFIALIGIFMPIIRRIHQSGHNIGARSKSQPDRLMSPTKMHQNSSPTSSSPSMAFAMYPEFAPTGLRRPSSASGESSSGAGSRRPFADTKESRSKMSAALANLGPSADSLRSMGLYDSERSSDRPLDPALLNLKLNLSANDDISPVVEKLFDKRSDGHQQTSSRLISKGEKRLVMLDVDPCCPRHGVGVWPRNSEPSTSKSGNTRLSHSYK